MTLDLLLISRILKFCTYFMNTQQTNNSQADYYFGFLNNLSADSKLDLISRLSQSLKQGPAPAPSLSSLFGAYSSEETAEEIITTIRNSRVSNRSIESL